MSAKTSSLFQGKKGNKKGIAGGVGVAAGKAPGGLIKQGTLSVRRTSEGDGKHAAFAVELRLGSGSGSDPLSPRCKKFKCDEQGFDDVNACARAYRFAAGTDEMPMFRAFVLEEGSGSADGSSADSEESVAACLRSMHSGSELSNAEGIGDQIPAARVYGRFESKEACERKPVSYVCLRKNPRVGLIFAVVMARLENGGQHGAISFQMHRRYATHDDEYVNGEEELLTRAITFLRSAAFEYWRKNGKNGANRPFLHGDPSGAQGRERGLKHPFSYVGIDDGEKVDCVCGKNRSKGLMVACEHCGVWEHAECLGYRFSSQIPEDYICSACIRAQKEEVVFIRLDEQGVSQIQYSDGLLIDPQERERFRDEPVCCVCGCEYNEDLENMIHPCSCGGGLAVAHSNCLLSALESTTSKERAKQAASSLPCPLCGGQGFVVCGNNGALASSDSGKEISPPKPVTLKRNSRRPSNSENSLKGVKRLRSALVQPGAERKNEMTENASSSSVKHEAGSQVICSGKKIDSVPTESIKSEVTVLGRRFADAAVTVPIKKRRIQLMEAVRSPSPPPRSPSPSPPPRSLSPSVQSDGLILKDDTSKEMAGNLDDEELKSMQDAEMAESGLLEDVEGTILTLKSLETESQNLKTELTLGKDQLSRLGESSSTNGEDILPVAQVNCMKEDILETVTKELETFDGADDKMGLSCSLEERRDVQDLRVSPVPSNIFESPQQNSECEGCRLWKTKIEMDSACWMAENGANKFENDHELQSETQKDLSMNSSAVVDKEQGQLNVTDGFFEIPVASKDEQQVSGSQSLEESSHANSLVHNRDDRSHWDLNMEMEAWERPCTDLSDADASLAKVKASSAMVTSDPHAGGEAMPVCKSQDSIRNEYIDIKDQLPEATQEKPIAEPSSSLETSPAAKCVLGFMPSEIDEALEDGSKGSNVMTTASTILSSEAFNQHKPISWQVSGDQDDEHDDGSKGDATGLNNSLSAIDSCQEGLLILKKISEANAMVSDMNKVEGETCSEIKDDTKFQVLESVGHVAVDALEHVLQRVSSAENLTSTFTVEETLDSQDDPLKNGNNNNSDVLVNFRAIQETEEKRESVESDAFEEDEQDADSPRSLQDICEGEDNQGGFGKMRSSDRDEGVGDDLEAEDVDYGDSENEDEQGHEDGDAYDLEAEEVTSAGSQEEMEFEDDRGNIEHEVLGNTDELGPTSLQSGDLGDDWKEDAGHRDQYVSDMDMEILHDDENEISQIDPSKANQEENTDTKDTRTCYEELAENAENAQDEESRKDDIQNAFDPLSFSKKTSIAVRAKSSGWDQLPEGFEKAEDALRAVKENSVRGGRGAPRGSYISGPGRGPPIQMDTGLGDRGRTDVSGRSRSDHREFGRGRSRGRGGSSSVVLRGRNRIDPWVNGAGGPPGQWAPKRHPSPPGRFGDAPGFGQRGQTNAAAIAAAKLESSGFVVAPDGTITKAGSAGNALRGGPRPFPGGGRSGSGVIFNSGRGSMGIGEMNLGTRVGMGPGRGFGFGPGMRGNMGMGMGMNMGANPGIRGGGPGRSGMSNRGMIERYRFPPRGVGNLASEHSLGRPVVEHSEKWNRRQRNLSPASLKLRTSPSSRSHRRSRSRSRTRSPRLRTPPRSGNGGSGSVLRQSRSPLHVRSVVKGESRESSPSGHRLIPPPPKLPLPPPPPRGQRSPPAGLKKLSERREVDRRYTDLEQARSIAQSHTSPRRLSSLIEQTAATSEEPDQQLLSSRQSSVTEKHRPSSSLIHISRSGSGRDLVSMESFGKSNSEVQRSSDDEIGDITTHIARKGETLLKEHRLNDAFWLDRSERDRRADAGLYKRKLGREDSRREFVKSRRDGRGGNNSRHLSSKEGDDEVAPRRRRAPL
ncbi:hypothetical protein O6H91_05G074300 [Diphasiastrum complanatum]|uniref:Uncharacterized protein n=2 Tax=Diphasiastrum complanatum TaxID=34168 RepID=A0ACC2DPV9_DIPCM|nr:hypothetical protein O6H91_05G074300 [Diphasiastrum complanatum]